MRLSERTNSQFGSGVRSLQELSLNVLDVAQNSIRAGAKLIEIRISRFVSKNQMTIEIKDNGCGMTKEQVQKVENPFFTTRTTRSVGLGVPLFKMSAEMTGGHFSIESEVGQGTLVTAFYVLDHIDLMPLGDMASTMVTLISMNPELDFSYTYQTDTDGFCLDTREVRKILEGIPLSSPQVMEFVREFIAENTAQADSESERLAHLENKDGA